MDDKYDRDHDAIAAHIKSITDQPVKYVLSTHYHEDHSGGNGKFLPTAEVISTANARTNIVKRVQSNASANVEPARVVFTDETAVFLGGKEVRAKFFGRGHTNGDAIIYFPALRTIHTGDLMAGSTPLIDYPGGGNLVEWTKTLDGALQLDFDTVVPGHGPIATKQEMTDYRQSTIRLVARVREMNRAKKSKDDIAQMLRTEFHWADLHLARGLNGVIEEAQ